MGSRFYVLMLFAGVAPLTRSSHREFFLIQQGKNWTEAQAYCRSDHTDLAVVRGDADVVRLQSEAQRYQFTSDAWVGLYLDIDSWRWSLGDTPLGPMRKWATVNPVLPEPNNRGGDQTCAAIRTDGWWDLSCHYLLPFVCFDARPSGNSSYVYYSEVKTWGDARSHCRQYHTDLASSRNRSEDATITEMASALTWIGLFRDSWRWLDPSNTFNMTWMPGQPDNAMWGENCAYVNGHQVADALCSDTKPFFCYTVTTRRTVRLKIDTDGDVRDPGLKESVLEMIRQKLKDRGSVQNLRLKWNEQAGGVAFQQMKINDTADVNEKTCDVNFFP